MIIICSKISIIVPVYKVEQFLPQCIDSILAQSFADFELILVDDGSPDNCPAICDEYAARDSRISVTHQKNGGLSSARNAGIAKASGEYLCFIDSDDLLSPEYCKMLLEAAVSTEAKIASCRIVRFSKHHDIPSHEYPEFDEATVMCYTDFLRKQMNREIEIGVCNKLFHRSVFETIHFMPGKLHEDIIFAGDLLSLLDCTVAYLDVPLYFYRQREDSIINRQANSVKCSPDRVYAGNYLWECAKKSHFPYLEDCFFYVLQYPWSFVDPIYVHIDFAKNRAFLQLMQVVIRTNRQMCRNLSQFSGIQRKRMLLFARSKILYGRLFRVYVYHILKLDAYADGHGI